MPEVKKGQSKSDYVQMCVPYVMKHEGATQEQAVGKCYGLYKYFKKKQHSKGEISDPNFEDNMKEINLNNGDFEANIEIT